MGYCSQGCPFSLKTNIPLRGKMLHDGCNLEDAIVTSLERNCTLWTCWITFSYWFQISVNFMWNLSRFRSQRKKSSTFFAIVQSGYARSRLSLQKFRTSGDWGALRSRCQAASQANGQKNAIRRLPFLRTRPHRNSKRHSGSSRGCVTGGSDVAQHEGR